MASAHRTRTLVVAANPEPSSLTLHVAHRLAAALPEGSADVADLHAEGFDPRFSLGDRERFHAATGGPDDVLAEHRRLEGASDLVLVFPVYWWSMPALLKGWIDRVLVNGWAFDDAPDGLVRRLGWLTIHLVPIAGSDAGLYERHGYETAIRTQIEHGIVDYCGAQRGVTAFVHDVDAGDRDATAALVDDVVQRIAASIVERAA